MKPLAPVHFPAAVHPGADQHLELSDPTWEKLFSQGDDEQRSTIAQAWLAKLNAEAHRVNKLVQDSNVLLHTVPFINEHHAFIARIKPYLDATKTKNLVFKGDAASLFQLSHSLDDSLSAELQVLVEHLWFGSLDQKKAAVLALPDFIATHARAIGEMPSWGNLLAHLAWEVVKTYELDPDYRGAAISLSLDAGFETRELSDIGCQEFKLWHSLTAIICDRDDSGSSTVGDDNREQLMTIYPQLITTPLPALLRGMQYLFDIHVHVYPETTLDEALSESAIFNDLFPEDKTYFDVLNRWAPEGKDFWTIAVATGMTVEESVRLGRSASTQNYPSPAISLPTDF